VNVRLALYFAYHRALRHGLPRAFREFQRQDRYGVPAGEVERRLRRLLEHCGRNVPYYAEIASRIGPPEADVLAYLRRFPLLGKHELRAWPDRLTSADAGGRRTYWASSGGSTGEPVSLLQDQDHWDQTAAIQLLHTTWSGHRFGRREVYVWGSERDVLTGTMGPRMVAVNLLSRRSYLNAFRMSEADMRSLIAGLNSRPPDLIVAYAQSLYEVARFARGASLPIRPQRAIIVTSETLHDFMRTEIEDVFGCRVLNRYGSREVGDIAGECPAHSGLHVFPWGNLVEIVDADGRPAPAGAEGEIVVTCLTNLAMPLVRYRIGDRGVLAPDSACPCGRRGQRFERVLGHSGETFKTADGVLVDGGYFSGLMYLRDWVERFQVVQDSHRLIRFRIVLRDRADPPAAELAEITDKVARVMGHGCDVRFDVVPRIDPLPSGKFTYTISHV
jgi:phenylacetate-CoA ligase